MNGKFVDENPVTGQVGSLISSEWGNAVTDELLNVIRAGGEQPSEADHDQLLAAIKTIVKDSIPPEKIRTTLAQYGITDAYTKSVTYTKAEIEALLKNMSALPVGAMVPFPKGSVPPGFLEVDGSVQSTAALPDLAAYLGTTFNTGGEGAGNFRLPESRGEFLRGWDHGRGVDAGRSIGSSQADEFRNHTHVNSPAIMLNSTPGTGGNAWSAGNQGQVTVTGVAGGIETRPRNVAVMWCIKAWNAPINQGNIDIAVLARLAAQATEVSQGTAKVATQLQMNAGNDDSTIATPKKLRLGFSISLAATGFVAFPTWLGGWVLQWGTTTAASVTFPMQFPTNIHHLSVQLNNFNSNAAYAGHYETVTATSVAGFSLAAASSSLGAVLKWHVIGN
ncbi:tail fiber protein [Pseudomonas sp. MF4836]|uniref:tail fiber protein n=1 Tax=Pseudomonas sp. MF4836 TaxID=1960827 RepID=UPI003FD1D142